MMRQFFAISITLILSACDPTPDAKDSIRVEFVDACLKMRAYKSIELEKRNELCRCTYDNAMQGLSEEAKNAARFYLLEQAGIKATSKNLVSKTPDMTIMVDASTAIGKAVKQCR